ncbi:MAG: hypothetical protein IJU70_11130 [Lentisphaeria bacterium]|nr:hypothetical protein [Lentisphaeria bacterium]
MKKKLSAFLKTPRGQLTAAVGALVLVWIVILVSCTDGLDSLFPDAARIAEARRELLRSRKACEAARSEKAKAEKLLADYNDAIAQAWREEKHGMVDTEFRRRVSEAARSVELTPDSLGAVKTSRINADFYYAELDISVRTGYAEMIKFIKAVEKITPRVVWRRIDLRPDRRPPFLGGPGNQGGSIAARMLGDDSSSKVSTRVGFSGTLRLIGYDGKTVPSAVRKDDRGGRK